MKKVKIYYVIFLFLLSFIWHYGYRIFPNFVTAIFFPVNESIWEHMKIIYGCVVFGLLFEKYLLKKYGIKYHNLNIEVFFKAFVGILLYLLIYIPLYLLIGENLLISIILLLIIYIIVELIGVKILEYDELYINILPVLLIVLGYVLFFIFTYYPPHNFIFFDFQKFLYGIKGS